MTGKRVPVLFVAVALLIAACGGDKAASTTTTKKASSSTTVAAPTKAPISIGLLCDRSGPTQLIGTNLCPGFLDYIDLVNSKKGGVEGHPIKVIDVDHAYEVPKAVAAYEQMKQQGIVALLCYGTPIALGLNEQVTKDKIPCLTPGFGIAKALDPVAYPYQFPLAASYYSQGAAAVDYVLKSSKGTKPKVAYLYYDNPAGQEPIAVLDKLAQQEGFELQKFAVPAPGIDMSAQVADITERYKADWVIAHLFGRAPSVSIKALKEAGFPLDHVVSLVWGAAEADIDAAGGFGVAEGYNTLQFAGVGQDYSVIKEIEALYKERGKPVPDALSKLSVYYNRGVFIAGMTVEALRLAVKSSGDSVTGESVKAGLESLKGYSLDGLAPPLNVTATDHEGGGFTRIFQVKAGKLSPIGDWSNPYHDLVLQVVKSG